MKKAIISVLALAALMPVSAKAEAWSLARCISYAAEHNISVRNAAVQTQSGRYDIDAAKDAFLPTVDASASQSFSFGRGLTSENIYANRNTSNFQWGASLNLPLFQGLAEYRRLDAARLELDRLLLEFEAAKDNVTLNVILQYLQVLYNREVEESAASQCRFSEYEVERQKALVEEGKVAEADLYDAESQAAQDRLQLVTARNDSQVALVNLANLLQLPSVDGFDVLPLEEAEPVLPRPEAVFEAASVINNSLLGARQALRVADKNISVAKSGYIPTLSFNAGVGSSYYFVNGYDNGSFSWQMRNNFSTYLGLSLRIPIFDAFSTRNNVRSARIRRLQAELSLEQQESDLYTNIRLAYYQALGAQERYFTSASTLEKTRLSFEATREKYNLGRSTPQEFEQAKNNLFRTEISRIQSHYEYLLRHKILEFYRTGAVAE